MKPISVSVFLVLIAMIASGCNSDQPSAADLQLISALNDELSFLNSEIQAAEENRESYSGGLLRAIIEMRIEILRTTHALVEQRIQALESGARISIEVPGTAPDSMLVKRILEDMTQQEAKIAEAQREASEYSGGLMKAMLDTRLATEKQTLAMLHQRLLSAKYGLPHVSISIDSEALSERTDVRPPSELKPDARSEPMPDVRLEIITVDLLSKRFEEQDFQDFIWIDVSFCAVGLDKSARAIKGTLSFNDLFGESKLKLNWTIDDPIDPGETKVERGSGFEYNQFTDSHKWIRAISIEDMTATFTVSSILYQDGTRRDF